MLDTNVIRGYLEIFHETGTEGVFWSLSESGIEGYDGLHVLEEGDMLRVFNDVAKKEVLFEGKVSLDRDTKTFKWPSGVEVQAIYPYVVHGIPKNCEPREWLKMFLDEKPAELVKKESNSLPRNG